MDRTRIVAVEVGTLDDLLALCDQILARVIEDPLHDAVHIRDLPMAVTDGIRGAVAEIRCHGLVAA